jgi:Gluconate 2-dehydrogenase subunit 3
VVSKNKNMNRRELLKNTALYFGYSMTVGAFSEAFVACASTSKATVASAPPFLSAAQFNLLSAVADTLLPKTATPSASEVGVPKHLDSVIRNLFTPKEQADFIANMENLDANCVKSQGKSFVECDAKMRHAYLVQLDREPNVFAPTMWGITLADHPPKHTFFNDLKGTIVASYFTTKEVSRDILIYEPIPGDYIGCMPYEGQNLYSGG